MSNASSGSAPMTTPMWLTATVLGLANAGWAGFQWLQLRIARAGGEAFCPLGDGSACTAIWDSAFANAIQETTVLPVAAWGVVWGLAAAGLAGLAWLAPRGTSEPYQSGAIWTALGGILVAAGLAAASLLSGGLCSTCAITYAGVSLYSAVVLFGTRPWSGLRIGSGVSTAVLATAIGYAAAFVPASATAPGGGKRVDALLSESGAPTQSVDDRLVTLVSRLDTREAQLFADLLEGYRVLPGLRLREPRSLLGPADARVRITEWIDPLCSHCKEFHKTLSALRAAAPEGSFAVETRHFPLDSSCNRLLQGESTRPIRCEAARAIICMEGSDRHFEFSGEVLEAQDHLSSATLFEIAERYTSRATFADCLRDPTTARKLGEDLEWAEVYRPKGTPLVVINGRPTVPWGPFLLGIILADGNGHHGAFASLPPPRTPEQLAQDQHAH